MIHTEEVVIASEGSRRFEGHLAYPTSGAGPALLIFSEMWGVAAKKRDMAEDYARRGWCAISGSASSSASSTALTARALRFGVRATSAATG